MMPEDRLRFFQSLAQMSELFQDEMTPSRQKLYWQLFADRATCEEWEYACLQTMQRETFHKVPLPAALWDYIREHRAEQHRLQGLREAQEREATRLVAQAERLALEASPEWQAEQESMRVEEVQRQQEYQAWLAQQPRSILIALGKINPPNNTRWRRLSEEELCYERPSDAEVAFLRRQMTDPFELGLEEKGTPPQARHGLRPLGELLEEDDAAHDRS